MVEEMAAVRGVERASGGEVERLLKRWREPQKRWRDCCRCIGWRGLLEM